jgi:hypothetical protein
MSLRNHEARLKSDFLSDQSHHMERRWTILFVVWPLLWLAILAGVWPVSVRLTPHSEELVAVWRWRWLLDWRGPLAALQIAGTALITVMAARRLRSMEREERARMMTLWPTLWLALLFPLLLYRHSLDPRVVANALYYGSVFVLLWPIASVLHHWTQRERDHDGLSKSFVAGLIVGASIFYWATGMAYTHWCGEHAGDEGHYLIQVASLYQDGDLDIRNQYEDMLGDQRDFYIEHNLLDHRLHVSPASRDGRWYSYHTPGLSLLAFWTYPFGLWARHLVLALVAGFGVGGLYVLCRLAGARHRASMVVLLLYMASLYAVVYASRFLPEMLGAALMAWLMVAVMMQKTRPGIAVVPAAMMVSALPWAHLRFLPMAGLGFGFFGLYGLFVRERWVKKVARLAAFTCLAGGGLLLFLYGQHRFFEGGYSHPVGALFMSHPQGIWQIFTRHPGLADVFPFVVVLIPAGFLGWRLPRAHGSLLLMLAVVFLVTWIITCSGKNFAGGATLAGRFLVAVTPLLLPSAALLWMHAGRCARVWMVWLALLSAALTVIQFILLPELGRAFACPFDTVPVVARLFWGWHPPWPAAWTICFAAALHALWIVWPRLHPRLVQVALGLLVGSILAGHGSAVARPSKSPPHWPGAAAKALADYRMGDVGVESEKDARPVSLFEGANQLVNRHGASFEPLRITADRLDEAHAGNTISLPWLGDNDWAGRGWGWATVWPPVNVGCGERVLQMEGRVEGGLQPVLAVREGSALLLEMPLPLDGEGRFAVVERFEVRSRRSLIYVLLYAAGEKGEILVEDLRLAPVSDRLLEGGRVTLP